MLQVHKGGAIELSQSLDQAKTNLRHNFGHGTEAVVWAVILVILAAAQFFNQDLFDEESSLLLGGLVISFILIYYTLIIRYFTDKQRSYIKDLADVVFIGILSLIARDYGVYFFALFILPIAAAAFALDIFNSLLVAIFACLFIAGNLVLNSQYFGAVQEVYLSTLQIAFLILLTFFTRALALQLRNEKTERTTAQEKLKEIDQKLEDLEATEEEFVSLTTHQLNTPLSIIRGYSSMLLEGDAGKLTAKQQAYVQHINQGGLRLAKLIKELLDITHMERGQALRDRKPVILNEIVNQSIDTLQDRASTKNIILRYSSTKESLQVLGNSLLLLQVVNNLIDNAVKFSNDRLSVDIRLEKKQAAAGPRASLTITDHGIGIPKEEQSRIFQRFYRATNSVDKDNRGNGLGLYLVKHIIEELGGSIKLTSAPSKGTTVEVQLPIQTEQEKQS